MPFLAAVVILLAILLFSMFNVLNEYERAVVFTLGRFAGIRGPGLILIVPVIQRMRRVDLRVIVLNVPKQDVITRDNVSVKVNAVVYFRIVDQSTENWGMKVSTVEIKDVDLDESMIRAMAKQAEAERTRRAKIIHAEGEAQAAQQLVEAAQALARQPSALQLRYLQTLADIAHERTQLIVFPLPLDLIKPFFGPRGE